MIALWQIRAKVWLEFLYRGNVGVLLFTCTKHLCVNPRRDYLFKVSDRS